MAEIFKLQVLNYGTTDSCHPRIFHINLFTRVSLLDQGLMTADDSLSGRLADFHRDHGAKFKTSMPVMIAFLAFPVILTVVALWSAFT